MNLTIEAFVSFAFIAFILALIIFSTEIIRLHKRISYLEKIQTTALKDQVRNIKLNERIVSCNDGKKRSRKEIQYMLNTIGRDHD